MDKNNDNLKIGELARITGTRQSTIQYYTEIGILPYKQEGKRFARRYNLSEATKRLKEIARLKDKRLKIEEIIEHFRSK